MIAAWICRVPIRMHTIAGLPLMEAKGIKRFILLFTERTTLWCAHRGYPNSMGLKKYMTDQLKFDPEKLKVIGKGSSNGTVTLLTQKVSRVDPGG